MIKKKLLITFMVISIIPMALVGQMVFYKAKASLRDTVLIGQNVIADLKEREVFLYLERLKTRSRDFALDDVIREQMAKLAAGDPQADARGLGEYLVKSKQALDDNILIIDLVDVKGQIVASTEARRIGTDLSAQKLFLNGRVGDYVSVLHVHEDGRTAIAVSAAVRDQAGKPLGALINHFGFSVFSDIFNEGLMLQLGAKTQFKGVGKTGKIYLVDRERAIITKSFTGEDTGVSKRADTYPVRACFDEGREVTGSWPDFRGVGVVGSSMCISVDDFQAVLISEQDESEATAPIRDLEKLSLALALVILIFIGLFAVQIAHLIADPIKRLQKSAEIIGSGDLSHQVERINTKDEIGQLAISFNKMAADLNVAMNKEKALVAQATLAAQKEKKRSDELQKTKMDLERHAAELTRSNKELEEFAYIASHDLQEPLRKVKTFGDRLTQKYTEALGDQGRDYIGRMENAIDRMQTLINDLLTYSRVTSKAQPFVAVDLNTIVREVLSDLEIKIEETGARIRVDGLPSLEADPLQMRQLFQNLIGNALKFTRPGVPPVIEVRSALQAPRREFFDEKSMMNESFRVITVADNGIGFEEKYSEQIFHIFQRLHGRNEYTGTGIGLAVCRKIVARHGGQIKAESMPGQGATFTVTLPIIQPKDAKQKEA